MVESSLADTNLLFLVTQLPLPTSTQCHFQQTTLKHGLTQLCVLNFSSSSKIEFGNFHLRHLFAWVLFLFLANHIQVLEVPCSFVRPYVMF